MYFSARFLIFTLTVSLFMTNALAEDHRKDHIVYMGTRLSDLPSVSSVYTKMAKEVIGSAVGPDAILHSYTRTFNGFVVKLTEQEVQKMATLEGVVSVFPNEKLTLHTTRSWDFIGFSEQVERTALENDIVIGVFDSGIWPESDSFNDTGFGPPPSKWKGVCQTSDNFTCNNKIIGAKFYRTADPFEPDEYQSPRDSNGHGTHVASIVAGSTVSAASLFGLGLGTARGGVPSARIAVYKVCWSNRCYGSDILAAFDDAIADGVDIISISSSLRRAMQHFEHPVAIGAFHAMRKGILTSTAAGNYGPSLNSTHSVSPWVLSVAASTIDRKFVTKVQFGDGMTFEGASINTFDTTDMYPLIYGGNAPNVSGNYTPSSSRYCLDNSLDPNLVKGKIVLCDEPVSGSGPLSAGAVGALMQSDTLPKDVAFTFPLPTSYLDAKDGDSIHFYLGSSNNATTAIFKSMEGNNTYAPYVAFFSSRGPNAITPDILKIVLIEVPFQVELGTYPGARVKLSKFSIRFSCTGSKHFGCMVPGVPNLQHHGDNRFSTYNIVYGTSVACPHASAAAAYVKSFHPTWSAAAIKSALMTTAFPMNSTKNPEAEFAYGAGHLNPTRAIDPGLVYDANVTDYVKFLCGQGYSSSMLQLITGDNSSCSEALNGTVWDLNYPSFALSVSQGEPIYRHFTRTVTNVGSLSSTYKSSVVAPEGLSIRVMPETLSFTSLGQQLSYVLMVDGSISEPLVSTSLVWDDGIRQVRSPVVVYVLS